MVGLNGANALRQLENLSLIDIFAAKQDILWMLYGRNTLKKLCIRDLKDFCFDPDTVQEVPDSIEALDLRWDTANMVPQSVYETSLRIIGRLPNLKELYQDNDVDSDFPGDGVDWRGLMPALSRLNKLRLWHLAERDRFSEVYPLGENLKCLKIVGACDALDDVLQAISTLAKLEELLITDEYDVLYLESQEILLLLAAGPVRRSLVTCSISLCTQGDQRTESMLQYFIENVECGFAKKAVGTRELLVTGHLVR